MQGLECCLPVESLSDGANCDNICEMLSDRKLQRPRLLLGAGHVGTLCLVCAKTPDFQKKKKKKQNSRLPKGKEAYCKSILFVQTV